MAGISGSGWRESHRDEPFWESRITWLCFTSPNCSKTSLSRSGDVRQLRPPTNSFLRAEARRVSNVVLLGGPTQPGAPWWVEMIPK